MLAVKDLDVRFGKNLALREVSLSLPQQGVVGLVGPNGAGKSTFLDVLSGFIQPTKGHVIDLSSQRVLRRRALILRCVRLHQVLLLPAITARKFLTLAQFPDMGTRMLSRRSFLEEVELDTSLPILNSADLLSKIEYSLGQLSWGEQRLISIAAALYSGKQIALLDEPFAGLDTGAKRALVSQLRTEKYKRLLIVAEHDIESLVQVADSVLVFVGGRLVAKGKTVALTPSRLLEFFTGPRAHAEY